MFLLESISAVAKYKNLLWNVVFVIEKNGQYIIVLVS
jgi:hypothetical protein